MTSTYLKESLAKLATLKSRGERIDSVENRAELRATYPLTPGNEYPAMCGQYIGLLMGAHWDIETALRSAERLEVIDREHERLVSIFEALDIDLDEETLTSLELMGRDAEWKDARRGISFAISSAVRNVQEGERDIEHDNATDALLAAGFVFDEETDSFTRGPERVIITLTNGRECRYEWTYEHLGAATLPLNHEASATEAYLLKHYGASGIHSGKSGEFSRLLELIQPKAAEVSQ